MVNTSLKIILPVLVLAGAALAARAIVKAAPAPKPREEKVQLPAVDVMEAVAERVRLDVETYGTVRAHAEINVVPEVQGRVVYVSASLREGGFIEKDEVLVRIDPRDYVLAKTQAEAQVAQAEARLVRENAEAEVAKKEWEKFGRGAPSALVLREPQLAEAKALLSSAEARLDSAELSLERTEILSPYDGRVRSENVDVGQFAVAGAPVAQIYSTEFAEVRLAIPDEEIRHLDLPLSSNSGEESMPHVVLPVVLRALFAGEEHEWMGDIVRTEGQVDPRTRVVHTVARVKNPYAAQKSGKPPLMVGMYVKAVIPGRWVEGVVRIPRSALYGRSEVLVVDSEVRLRHRRIEILRRQGTDVIVSAGLEAGDLVCLTPVDPAVDGMRVEIAR